MARTKEFDPEIALRQAMEVFWHKGYKATSVENLLDSMGINRGTLYDTFGDKHALFSQALERYRQDARKEIQAMAQRYDSPMQFIQELLNRNVTESVHDTERRGCFMNNTIVELAPHDEHIQAIIRTDDAEMRAFFADIFAQAQARGEIAAEANIPALVTFLRSAMHAIKVMAKTNPDRETLQTIADGTMFTLKQHTF